MIASDCLYFAGWGPSDAFRIVSKLSFQEKIMQKNLIKKLAVVQAAALLASGSAFAAVPPEATAAITTAGADMLTAVGAVIAAMVAVWGLKKLGSKMGWL